MSTREANIYRGPADITFSLREEGRARIKQYENYPVLLEQTMPGLYGLKAALEDLVSYERVQIELPEGKLLAGPIISVGPGRLVFRVL